MCQDYIYDKDMEQIAKDEQRKAWKMQGMKTKPPTVSQPFNMKQEYVWQQMSGLPPNSFLLALQTQQTWKPLCMELFR